MKQRRVTMADVAAKLGLSRIAVSMALRDHHRISLERRREIRRVAREMGFVPDPFLSALAAHRRQRVVGDSDRWRLGTRTNSLSNGLGTNCSTTSGLIATNHQSIDLPSGQANGSVLFRLVYR